MPLPKRIVLHRCEFGVPAQTEESVEPCNEPAAICWEWPNGDTLFVCEEHDKVVDGEMNCDPEEKG